MDFSPQHEKDVFENSEKVRFCFRFFPACEHEEH